MTYRRFAGQLWWSESLFALKINTALFQIAEFGQIARAERQGIGQINVVATRFI